MLPPLSLSNVHNWFNLNASQTSRWFSPGASVELCSGGCSPEGGWTGGRGGAPNTCFFPRFRNFQSFVLSLLSPTGFSFGQQTSGRRPEKPHTEPLKYWITWTKSSSTSTTTTKVSPHWLLAAWAEQWYFRTASTRCTCLSNFLFTIFILTISYSPSQYSIYSFKLKPTCGMHRKWKPGFLRGVVQSLSSWPPPPPKDIWLLYNNLFMDKIFKFFWDECMFVSFKKRPAL